MSITETLQAQIAELTTTKQNKTDDMHRLTLELAEVEAQLEQLNSDLAMAMEAEQPPKTVRTKKGSFTIDNITEKDRIRYGVYYEGFATGVAAHGIKNEYVTFIADKYGYRSLPNGEQTFRVGDEVIYDSYNIHYWGIITGITEKGISIEKRYGGRCRLGLAEFISRNLGYDYDEIKAQDSDIMHYI